MITGQVKKDKITKKLIKRLKPQNIALIKHKDLDELSAISLLNSKVKCIINAEPTISGKFLNQGPKILANKGMPIYELDNSNFFEKINENDIIKIEKNAVFCNNQFLCNCKLIKDKDINTMEKVAKNNMENQFLNFVNNTIFYANKEKEYILEKYNLSHISTKFKNKEVLIISRGRFYNEDLNMVSKYIKYKSPILIGVDGGGDALLNIGFNPDVLIGDMDSVSDQCLKESKEILVHTYMNGNAPGLKRLKKLKIPSKLLSLPGTSEDAAIMLAYKQEASFIYLLGSHNNMIDFLEKGREGMGSTFLVRLLAGHKIIDLKGIHKLMEYTNNDYIYYH